MKNHDIHENFQVSRRSPWSILFTIIGCILLAIGLFFFIWMFNSHRGVEAFLVSAIGCIAGGLNCLLFGFLINVFTDIRWYLQKIAINSMSAGSKPGFAEMDY